MTTPNTFPDSEPLPEPLTEAQREVLAANTEFCVQSGIATRHAQAMVQEAEKWEKAGIPSNAAEYQKLAVCDFAFGFSLETGNIADWHETYVDFWGVPDDELEENYFYRELNVYRHNPEVGQDWDEDHATSQIPFATSVGDEPFRLHGVFADLDPSIIEAAIVHYDAQKFAGLDQMDSHLSDKQ